MTRTSRTQRTDSEVETEERNGDDKRKLEDVNARCLCFVRLLLHSCSYLFFLFFPLCFYLVFPFVVPSASSRSFFSSSTSASSSLSSSSLLPHYGETVLCVGSNEGTLYLWSLLSYRILGVLQCRPVRCGKGMMMFRIMSRMRRRTVSVTLC